MSSELSILALSGLWVMVTILIQVLATLGQVDLMTLARSRDDMPELSGAAGRLVRAVNNSIVAFALFAPAVLLLHVQGTTSAASLLAAQIFFIARLVYVPIYATGIPWLRTLTWIAGFFATGYLYILAL